MKRVSAGPFAATSTSCLTMVTTGEGSVRSQAQRQAGSMRTAWRSTLPTPQLVTQQAPDPHQMWTHTTAGKHRQAHLKSTPLCCTPQGSHAVRCCFMPLRQLILRSGRTCTSSLSPPCALHQNAQRLESLIDDDLPQASILLQERRRGLEHTCSVLGSRTSTITLSMHIARARCLTRAARHWHGAGAGGGTAGAGLPAQAAPTYGRHG